MTERGSLQSLGMPPALATQIGYSLSALTLKATGTTKATALALIATMNVMGTVSHTAGIGPDAAPLACIAAHSSVRAVARSASSRCSSSSWRR